MDLKSKGEENLIRSALPELDIGTRVESVVDVVFLLEVVAY